MIQVLFLALCLLWSTIASAADYTSARQYVLPIVVTQVVNPSGELALLGSGSSVVIANSYAITAAHVIPTTPKQVIFAVDGFGRRIEAIPIKIDRNADLALLSLDVKCPCAPISGIMPVLDDPLVSIGYPLYLTYQVQLASVGGYQGMHRNKMVSTSLTAPGGSGGGIFMKRGERYELVGISVAIASAPLGPRMINIDKEYNWFTFGVPVTAIQQFLKNTGIQLTQ